MAEPDLSKVISLIMSNEDLVRQIKDIAQKSEEEPTKDDALKNENVSPTAALSSEQEYIQPDAKPLSKKTKRAELLRALKPYVSGERREAIESMMSIADILEMMRES